MINKFIRNSYESVLKIKSVLKKDIYNQFGIKVSINKNSYIYLFVTVILLFYIYLSAPSLYNFDKIKPDVEKEIYNQFGLKVNINKINYFVFPTPRLKIQNAKIYNFSEKKEILSSKNTIIIPIDVFNLIGTSNIKFISFIIDNISFDLKTSSIANLKNFYFKILNSKKLVIKNGEVRVKNNDNIISIIKIKNLLINPEDKKNKLIANTNIYNLDVNFIHEKNSSSVTKSGLQIFIPKLGAQIKTNILDENIKGTTIVKFFNNMIEFDHEFLDNKIKLTRSKVNLDYLEGFFWGEINFDPFLFDISFDIENFYFSKLLSSPLIKTFKANNVLPINNKMNGNINFNITNIRTKSNFISSGKIDLEFRNGIIDINKFNLLIKDIGYINIDGYLLKQDKKNYFTFDTNIKIQDKKLLYSRLTIPKNKRINKIDLDIKSLFDFNNNKLIIKELKNVNSLSKAYIESLNKQINNFILNKSINEIFNYFNLRLLIKNIIK